MECFHLRYGKIAPDFVQFLKLKETEGRDRYTNFMKVLVASDSYKGCMSSKEANRQIEKGILRADPDAEVVRFPVSDGGEGMVDAFVSACRGRKKKAWCQDLYGKPMQATYGVDEKTGTCCIEAASCLGLTLYPREKREPLKTSSYGLGLLLQEVIKKEHPQHVIIGLGGTGSNDAGMGFLEAFGARFFNKYRRQFPISTGTLSQAAFIDKSRFRFPRNIQITAACDVTNPLLGEKGATYVFGRQKGLTGPMQARTEAGIRHIADKIMQTFHKNIKDEPGSGAAGGLGGTLIGLLRAERRPGLEVLAEIGNLDDLLDQSDLLITGEGQSDAQTLYGKAVFSLAGMAGKKGVPVICLSGALGVGYEQLYDYGIIGIFSTADRAMSFPAAIAQGPVKLEQSAFSIMKMAEGLLAAEKKKTCN